MWLVGTGGNKVVQRDITISEICMALELRCVGENQSINGLNLCNRSSVHDRVLTYAMNGSYVDIVRNNPAIVGIILQENDYEMYAELCTERKLTFIFSATPEEVFYDIHDYLYYKTDFYDKFDYGATVGENCNIHPTAIIENGVTIGKNVAIGPNSVIRKGTIIGDDCEIGCNTTIGSEGFQIIRCDGKNRKIVHSGGLCLAEGVSVGDNVTICNSLFENTAQIGKRVMIDNNAYIGHNVTIGDDAVITSSVVLCGSATIEAGAWIGVNSSVLNRVTVGADVKIGMGSVVTRNIPNGNLAYGVPARVKI